MIPRASPIANHSPASCISGSEIQQLERPMDRRGDIDVAKGIGILLVVVGHLTSGMHEIIYLFHMPLFFVLAGFVIKVTAGAAWKGTKKLLVPYFAYLVVLAVLPHAAYYAMGLEDRPQALKSIAKACIGGELLVSPLNIFWFPTCLAAARVMALLSLAEGKRRDARIAVLAGFACLSVIVADIWPNFFLPFALNVAPIAALLIVIGSLLNPVLTRIPSWQVVALCAVAAMAAGALEAKLIGSMEMKYAAYGTPVLSVLAGVTISFAVIAASRFLVASPFGEAMAALGARSVTIMYLHMPLAAALMQQFGLEYPVVLISSVVLGGFLVHKAVARQPLARMLFLGETKSHRDEPASGGLQ